MKDVIVSGAFDDLRLKDFRFLDEASKLGSLRVLLWSDELVQSQLGKPPKFPLAEREYLVRAIRFVSALSVVDSIPERAGLTNLDQILQTDLQKVPSTPAVPEASKSARKKVIVTGCYDWFHSGHVRFFEECSEIGDLYVVVGHDENIKFLKGVGHPLFPDTQRRYIVGAIRYVKQAFISSGMGWMDAEPEILRLQPDIYAVNEDGDKPEKAEFCRKKGLEYRVLKRLPKPGLPRRESTSLRGF